jgi:hypothetical protein
MQIKVIKSTAPYNEFIISHYVSTAVLISASYALERSGKKINEYSFLLAYYSSAVHALCFVFFHLLNI